MYFVGSDLFDLATIKRIKKGEEVDFDVQVWYAQGNNYDVTTYKNLDKDYIKNFTLVKNQLVYIELNSGRKGMCYINGFSSGMLFVSSVTGDEQDLYGDGRLFDKKRASRYYVTISTIKEIRKLEITKLGEINGL